MQGVGIKEKDALGRTAMQYACNEMVVNYLEKALNKILIYRDCFEINLQVTLYGSGRAVQTLPALRKMGNVLSPLAQGGASEYWRPTPPPGGPNATVRLGLEASCHSTTRDRTTPSFASPPPQKQALRVGGAANNLTSSARYVCLSCTW